MVLGPAVAGQRVAGLGHGSVRVGTVVEHREQSVDGAETDRVSQQVELAEGRLVLAEEVVERSPERLGRLDHTCALSLDQLAEQLGKLTPPSGGHRLPQAGAPGSPGRSDM